MIIIIIIIIITCSHVWVFGGFFYNVVLRAQRPQLGKRNGIYLRVRTRKKDSEKTLQGRFLLVPDRATTHMNAIDDFWEYLATKFSLFDCLETF